MKSLGIVLFFLGIVVALTGLAIFFGDKLPFLGKLPGDSQIDSERGSFHFPVVTCLIVSVVLTLVLNLVLRLLQK